MGTHESPAHPFPRAIASRSLRKPDGSEVSVRIYEPQPVENAPDEWICAYRIEDSNTENLDGYARGIDGVQALLLAAVSIGDRLSLRAEPLTFLGGPELRFPRTPAAGADFCV
jgi:hypothetical protein